MVRGVVKLREILALETTPGIHVVVFERPRSARGPAFGVAEARICIDASGKDGRAALDELHNQVGSRFVVAFEPDAMRSPEQEQERARAFLAKRWHRGADAMLFYPGDLGRLLVEYAHAWRIAGAETLPAPAAKCELGAWGGPGCRRHEGHDIGADGMCVEGRRGAPAHGGPAAYVDASAPKGLTFTVSVGSPNLAGGITIKGLSLDDVCEALKLSDVDRARLLSARPGEGIDGTRHAARWTVTREPLAEAGTLTGFWPSTTLAVHASVKVPEPWARVLKQVRDGAPLAQGDHAAAEVLQVLGLCYRPTGWPWALTGVGAQALSAYCAAERDAAAQPAGVP
jgi:hypothetical protein